MIFVEQQESDLGRLLQLRGLAQTLVGLSEISRSRSVCVLRKSLVLMHGMPAFCKLRTEPTDCTGFFIAPHRGVGWGCWSGCQSH